MEKRQPTNSKTSDLKRCIGSSNTISGGNKELR